LKILHYLLFLLKVCHECDTSNGFVVMMREGFTLWFTGWSGAGKTTLASLVEKELRSRGHSYIQRLDGDVVRGTLCRDLGFSKEDRDENIRRVTIVAEMLSKNGVIVLVSFISPYRSARDEARRRCQSFIEVYVCCDKAELIRRDVKGLYQKAISGSIENFTGVSDPYEEPENPEIMIDSSKQTEQESLQTIMEYLEENGHI